MTDELVPLSDEEHQAMEESMVVAGDLTDAAPEFPPGRAAPPLEEYVAAHVEACRAAMLRDGLKDPIVNGAGRLLRAERYARWRWQGYVDGHVNSL